MPIYEYRCASGHVTEEYARMDAIPRHLKCKECGKRAPKIISKVGFAMGDIQPYRSMVTGELIGSRSTHRAHLKQHGLLEVGNERPPQRTPVAPDGVRESIRAAMEK